MTSITTHVNSTLTGEGSLIVFAGDVVRAVLRSRAPPSRHNGKMRTRAVRVKIGLVRWIYSVYVTACTDCLSCFSFRRLFSCWTTTRLLATKMFSPKPIAFCRRDGCAVRPPPPSTRLLRRQHPHHQLKPTRSNNTTHSVVFRSATATEVVSVIIEELFGEQLMHSSYRHLVNFCLLQFPNHLLCPGIPQQYFVCRGTKVLLTYV